MTAEEDASLPQFLSLRARNASDGRLVLDVALGIVAIAAAVAFRPAGRLLILCAGACIAAFGLWGIADRELAEREETAGAALRVGLQALRLIAAVAGIGAALLFLFAALGMALGRIIS